MASRLFLTLLALLTGLAAQIGPAQARSCVPADRVEMGVAAVAVTIRVAAVPAALAQLPEPGGRNARAFSAVEYVRASYRSAPTVLIGIDRARE